MHLLIFISGMIWTGVAFGVDITLLGYVNTGKSATSSAVFYVKGSKEQANTYEDNWYSWEGPELTKVVRVNGLIEGYTFKKIRNRGVVLVKDGVEWFVMAGDSLSSGDAVIYRPEVAIKDGLGVGEKNVEVSSSLRDYIRKDGLMKILWQAAAVPETSFDGSTRGYALYEIEPGSIYDLAGFRDGDIFLELNGTTLSNPFVAVRALNMIKDLDEFTFKYERDGVQYDKAVAVR